MFNKLQQQSLTELIAGATIEELIWMNGFLSGALASRNNNSIESIAPVLANSPTQVAVKITIAFGTETGNAKALAGKLSAQAKQQGFIVKAVSVEQYKPENLSKEQLLFVVISTHGDGEPPAAARKFYDYLMETHDKLPQLQYGVIALGDSSYPRFCQTGKEVDDRLHQLGASRISPLQLCDTDYEDSAVAWFTKALTALQSDTFLLNTRANVTSIVSTHKKQHVGKIIRNVNLNDQGSEKQTHHIELLANDVHYEPGDSLGIIPENPLPIVKRILELAAIQASDTVVYRGETFTIQHLLTYKVNITYLPVRLVKKYAVIAGYDIPEIAIALSDLLAIYPLRNAQHIYEVLEILEPISPRLYSISSSPATTDNEVHILVKRDEFLVGEDKRLGLCSDFLTTLSEGTEVNFYIHSNKKFRLPAPDIDVIMIGAGTGIAPFRAFVADRAAKGAIGRNWLFFGEQRFTTDFLYQTEWQAHFDAGVLTKINTAFSRDQKEKIYVQHKLLEEGQTVYEWLENGACIYVCGARTPMSTDVEKALLQIIATYGGQSAEEARAYLDGLKQADQYLQDVY
jgi:sulfite reductase (NADPH) flavoprotein alpha-component